MFAAGSGPGEKQTARGCHGRAEAVGGQRPWEVRGHGRSEAMGGQRPEAVGG